MKDVEVKATVNTDNIVQGKKLETIEYFCFIGF